jgi:nitrate/nitrite-specific signal transduction histidine kinase
MDAGVCLEVWRDRSAPTGHQHDRLSRRSFVETEPNCGASKTVLDSAGISAGGVLRQIERAICGSLATLTGRLRTLSSSGALEQALVEVIREFKPACTPCRAVVTGKPKPLEPRIHEQVCLIGREALLNAFHHSEASLVEVEVEYHSRGVRLMIRDNGRGIDADAIKTSRTSHWGLLQMEERARSLGAQLRIWTRRGLGTEVEVSI